MGCGASSDPKIAVADNNTSNRKTNNTQNKNGFKQVELKNNSYNYSNGNSKSGIPEPTKAPLAFVISFDENNKKGNINRPPPGRLQLEPLKHQPKLTQQQLEEKMRATEQRREQILADRAKSSSVKKRPSGKSNNGERYDSDSYNNNNNNSFNKNNGYENGYRDDSDRNRSRDGDRRERLLNKMRIVPNEHDDSEVEHDPNYRTNNRHNDYNGRRYS